MQAAQGIRHLARWSGALAAAGSLIFLVAASFLASALWHMSLLSGYGPTYIVLAPVPAVAFAFISVLVLIASVWVWRQSRFQVASLAQRLSLTAIIATVVAWLAVGIAFLVLSGGWGAA